MTCHKIKLERVFHEFQPLNLNITILDCNKHLFILLKKTFSGFQNNSLFISISGILCNISIASAMLQPFSPFLIAIDGLLSIA